MNKDIASTVAGLVTAVSGLLALFNVVVPQPVSGVISLLGIAVLGYLTNKK